MERGSTPQQANSIVVLTRGLAGGDEAAFREFHANYFDRLYRFLLVVARGNEDEAQEALQQTFLRVARYARVFKSEEAFWSWLKVVARSAARDAGRKRQRYAGLLQRFALMWKTTLAESVPNEENRLRDCLQQCLEELAAEDRQLIEAKYLHGETTKELACNASSSEKALESRLLRLRRQLRQSILKKLNSA